MTTTISVTPGYIGQKTSADRTSLLTYSITTDGTMSDITEKINGVTIATRTNPTSGQEFTVSLTQAQWDAIKYGNAHTLTITMGSDTWTYTFDKRLNANDDILSAVKGVQDLQDHLNSVKAQLGSAIRANGGTVNDTDAWSAFVSAIANMTNKRWASGTATNTSGPTFTRADGTTFTGRGVLSVTGLDFTPSSVLIWAAKQSLFTVLFPSTLYQSTYPYGRIIVGTYSSGTTTSATVDNVKLEGNANVFNGGFNLPVAVTPAISWNWIAFE